MKAALTEVIYQGAIFQIEGYMSPKNTCLSVEWLEKLSQTKQAKYAALFKQMGDFGKIYNERKFKHLTGTHGLYEFKVDEARLLSFFVFGGRIILTHGFSKRSQKTPQSEIYRAQIIRDDFFRRLKK